MTSDLALYLMFKEIPSSHVSYFELKRLFSAINCLFSAPYNLLRIAICSDSSAYLACAEVGFLITAFCLNSAANFISCRDEYLLLVLCVNLRTFKK